MSQTPTRGQFIVFEGIDGSGKSTQVRLLAEHFRNAGRDVHVTQQPSDRSIGKLLRAILTGKEKTDQRAIAALFLADRIDHITAPEDGLLDRLATGQTVICDRYYFSSFAYNSLKVSMDWVIEAHAPVFDLLRPDLVLYLDLPIEVSLERIRKNREGTELFEKRETLEQVRANYLTAFTKLQAGENIRTVSADRSLENIADEIRHIVEQLA